MLPVSGNTMLPLDGNIEKRIAYRIAVSVALKEMRKSVISKVASVMGKKGGANAAKKLREGKTPEQVSATMRAVANARYAKARAAIEAQQELAS